MEPAVRCHLIRAAGTPPIIVLVVDDSADDDLTAAFARESAVPSPNFWGVWGTGKNGDADTIAFRLIDRDTHRERTWWLDTFGPPLLGAILEIPHIVVVQPREIADALKLSDATSADVIGLRALAARRPVRPRDRAVRPRPRTPRPQGRRALRGLHHLRVTRTPARSAIGRRTPRSDGGRGGDTRPAGFEPATSRSGGARSIH